MVSSHLNITNYFNGIKRIIHKAPAYPRPCRIVRVLLARLFVYGGLIKRFDPKVFAAAISADDPVPETFHPTAAVYFLCLNHLSNRSCLPAPVFPGLCFFQDWTPHVKNQKEIMFFQ